MLECCVCGLQYVDSTCTRSELGLITISHVIVDLTGVLQWYPRLTFLGILPGRVTGGPLKMSELLS